MSTKRKIIINLSILLISGIVFVVLIVDKSMEDMWKAKGSAAYDTRNEYYGLQALSLARVKLIESGFELDGALDSMLGLFAKKVYESAIEKIPEDDAERFIFYDMYTAPKFILYKKQKNKEEVTKEVLYVFKNLSEKEAASEWVRVIEKASVIDSLVLNFYHNNKPYVDDDFEFWDEKITAELTKLTKESMKIFHTGVFLKKDIPSSQRIIPLVLAYYGHMRVIANLEKTGTINCASPLVKDLLFLRISLITLLPAYEKEEKISNESIKIMESAQKELDETQKSTRDIFKNCNVRMEMNNDW